ncbi:hypothetical protein K402DRAFT_89196 [Aulographum hederae CBS 113979]|uniref:Uncharacterized protein n=1 Tax=Aulographum hederae CBS 113979 TaxID=1176131 RepID=A0A6G1H066_9PEZI|nr:hypothetical protein K402DRAFT_89196 [Aulographum hederae CBS 113979]
MTPTLLRSRYLARARFALIAATRCCLSTLSSRSYRIESFPASPSRDSTQRPLRTQTVSTANYSRRARRTSISESIDFRQPQTILTDSPHRTAQEDFLSNVQPLPADTPTTALNSSTFVFFTTLSFGQWFTRDQKFIESVLEKLTSKLVFPQEEKLALTAIGAVVDLLPEPPSLPRNSHALKQFKELSGQDRVLQPHHSTPAGREGLAYCVANSDCVETVPDSPDRSRTPSLRTVTIRNICPVHESVPDGLAESCQVPLANTIFQNGNDSTLFISHWTRGRHPGPLHLVRSDIIKSAAFSISRPLGSLTTELIVPLLPLTLFCRMASGMGNILRTVKGAKDDSREFPASVELEKAVSSYFRATGLPPHPLTVWALIIPAKSYNEYRRRIGQYVTEFDWDGDQNTNTLSPKWETRKPIFPFHLLAARLGGSLRKVLSGGGGWGKKAGLLSLDPAWSFDGGSDGVFDDTGGPPGWDLDETFSSDRALKNIVKTGDYIQFCTTTNRILEQTPPTGDLSSSLIVGTAARRSDESSDGPESSDPPTETKMLVYADHFGVLSEKGISLSSKSNHTRTKLDVPNSWLVVKEYTSAPNAQHLVAKTFRPI